MDDLNQPPVADVASRLVVGYDGSPAAETALDAAVEAAHSAGGYLHLVTAVESAGDAYRRSSEEAVRLATARASALLGAGRVTSSIALGAPSSVLLNAVTEQDLLVLGPHGHRPVARVLLGSTSTAVAAIAPCPVLIVRGPRVRLRGPVVVGVDGSPSSLVALAHAAQIASARGAPLRAVLAMPPATDALGFSTGPEPDELKDAERQLADAVAGVRSVRRDVQVDEVITQTHPVEALLRHSHGARLVVVGSRGLTGIDAVLLGSVSVEVLRHASCPVLVARGQVSGASTAIHARFLAQV